MNQNSMTFFVVHFTGGTPNLKSLEDYWWSQCGIGSNSHYGIERYDNQWARAGDIWQFGEHYDGACANCCCESGAAPFLPCWDNLNVHTISVECINPDTGNLGAMPQAQFDSLVYLIQHVCQQEGIPTDRYSTYWNDYEDSHTWADGGGGIVMHRDIAPHNRRMCPGDPYYNGQMDNIMKAVNGGQISGGTDKANYVNGFKDKNGWIIRKWESFYSRLNEKRPVDQQLAIPRRDTGIFNRWKEELLAGNDMGGVMSEEFQYEGYMLQDCCSGQLRFNISTHEIDIIYPGY